MIVVASQNDASFSHYLDDIPDAQQRNTARPPAEFDDAVPAQRSGPLSVLEWACASALPSSQSRLRNRMNYTGLNFLPLSPDEALPPFIASEPTMKYPLFPIARFAAAANRKSASRTVLYSDQWPPGGGGSRPRILLSRTPNLFSATRDPSTSSPGIPSRRSSPNWLSTSSRSRNRRAASRPVAHGPRPRAYQ